MGATDTVKFFAPEQAAAFLSYIEMPYTVYVHGHKRFDDNGQPYIVGNYTATRAIPEQIRILFNLAIYTGLRKGKLLASQWEDIDCREDYIRVCKSVTIVDGSNGCVKRRRTLSKRPATIWQSDNWVFNQDNGKIMSYSTPYHALQDTINRYNKDRPADQQLPLIPFHGFPHTYQPPCSSQPAGPKDGARKARPRPDLNDHEHLRPCSPGERPQGR